MEAEDVMEVSVPTPQATSRAGRVLKPTKRSIQTCESGADNGLTASDNGKVTKTMIGLLQWQTEATKQLSALVEQQSKLLVQQGKQLEDQAKQLGEQAQYIKILTERLDNLSTSSGPSATTSQGSASYANAVRSGLSSDAATSPEAKTMATGSRSVNPSSSASQQDATVALSLVIDLRSVEGSTHRTDKPGTTRKRIDDALANFDGTSKIRCRGLSRNPTDANKFKIFLGSENDTRIARKNRGWAEARFPGAKLQAEKWYPVRVDNVCKEVVLNNSHSTIVKGDMVEQSGQENEVSIHQIRWLSKTATDKTYGSMVVYLARQEDAEKLLREGMMDIEGETGFVRHFEKRVGPIRCFKRHQFNHITTKCPSSEVVCGQCAQKGHGSKICTSTEAKCALYGGPHSTYDNQCRLYLREKDKYTRNE